MVGGSVGWYVGRSVYRLVSRLVCRSIFLNLFGPDMRQGRAVRPVGRSGDRRETARSLEEGPLGHLFRIWRLWLGFPRNSVPHARCVARKPVWAVPKSMSVCSKGRSMAGWLVMPAGEAGDGRESRVPVTQSSTQPSGKLPPPIRASFRPLWRNHVLCMGGRHRLTTDPLPDRRRSRRLRRKRCDAHVFARGAKEARHMPGPTGRRPQINRLALG